MRRGRLSAELQDVLRCVSSMRPSTVVLAEERREAHRVRVLRSGGCANRRGTLVDELGLQRGRHRRSRTRRRQRGGANVQRESGRGDDGQHFVRKEVLRSSRSHLRIVDERSTFTTYSARSCYFTEALRATELCTPFTRFPPLVIQPTAGAPSTNLRPCPGDRIRRRSRSSPSHAAWPASASGS